MQAARDALAQLPANQRSHFAGNMRRRIERLDHEATIAFRALQDVFDDEAPLAYCRSLSCLDKVTTTEAFEHMGFCEACYAVAVKKAPRRRNTWADLNPCVSD
ncbi:MAG: hypothetical protein ACRDYB_17315 [Acidimicrobiales bacterium]